MQRLPGSFPTRIRITTGVLLFQLVLGAACGSGGGGGGGGEAAVSVSFLDAGSARIEGDSVEVSVRLDLLEEELLQDLAVVVRDAGTGSATSGVDYAEFAAQPILFPAGTVDGTTASVALDLLRDGLFEGTSESIELELSAPSGGTALGTRRHRIELLDRDTLSVDFLAPVIDVVEDNARFHALQLRASSSTGSLLGKALRVIVRDTALGTARPGSDYRFPVQVVDLEPGALEGNESVLIEVLADLEPEGVERLFLRLEVSDPEVFVSAPVLEVRLLDPPAQDEPFLVLRVPQFGLSSGNELEFGAPGTSEAAYELELVNRGRDSLHFGFPLLEGDARDFRFELLDSAHLSSDSAAPLPGESPALRSVAWGDVMRLREGPDLARVRGVALTGGERVDLELIRRSAPVAPGARLALSGQAGPMGQPGVFFGGRVAGEPDSAVFLALGEAGARGWIQRGSETLQLVWGEDGSGPAPRWIAPNLLAWSSSLAPCDTVPPRGAPDPLWRIVVPPADPLPILRLAIETDVAFFQRFGEVPAAEAYVIELVAATREITRRDLGLDLTLVYLGLYPDGDDPWLTADFGTPLELLNEFRARWRNGGAPAEAELSHFLSGALAGGIGELGGYCGRDGAFAVSKGVSGSMDWSTFDGSPSPFNFDLYLFAHELGHNLGAPHTQDQCPPLDQCVSNCTGSLFCGTGTLMSYCSLCPGGAGNIRLQYHPFTADGIRRIAEFSCLPDGVLPGGSSLRWRVTYAPDPIAPDPTRRRAALLRLHQDAGNVGPELSLSLVGH